MVGLNVPVAPERGQILITERTKKILPLPEGRIRQSLRMKSLADFEKKHGRIVICDFVCPTHETKRNFNPDITVWMNTIKSGRYEDTNRMFESPFEVDYEVNEMNDHNHKKIANEILRNV